MSDDGLVNKGIIINRPAGLTASGARTLIVTGLQRSGTSLVSSMLQQAGVFMGQQLNDAVFEDEEMLAILRSGDLGALRHLIARRNADYGTWGFKVPIIYTDLHPEQLALFGNPHLIVPFRDVASIAVRKSLSEFKETIQAMREAVDQLDRMVAFVASASAPSLLLSYEKILMFRDDFVDALIRFCGLPDDAALRARMIDRIEPNHRHYINHARQVYRGFVDGIIDECICGWCQLIGGSEPVLLDLHVDDRVVASATADMFRQDLVDAGIGDGRHGFRVDLRPFATRPDTVIRVKVARWSIELEKSGRNVAQYRTLGA
jgi:hypothetical protein